MDGPIRSERFVAIAVIKGLNERAKAANHCNFTVGITVDDIVSTSDKINCRGFCSNVSILLGGKRQ